MTTFLIVMIVVAAVLAMVLTFVGQRNGRRRTFRLEIANQGNVASAYLLRPESPDGSLAFRLTLDNHELPALEMPAEPAPPVPVSRPNVVGSARQSVDKTMGIAGSVAGALLMLGQILPNKLAGPFNEAAATIRQKQMKVQKVERMPGKVKRLKDVLPAAGLKKSTSAEASQPSTSEPVPVTSVQASAPQPRFKSPDGQPGWRETPPVQPLETLILEMSIRSAGAGRERQRPFRVTSHSEAPDTPPVVEEGSVQFATGFWASPFLPYLAIFATAALSAFLVIWAA